jgi:hypothetical protein
VALSAGVAEAVPTSFLLPDVSLPCCLACQPSAAAPRPRPLRCGLLMHTARRVKAAQEDGSSGGGALVLALTRCATLGQPHGGSIVKGSKGVDF